MDFAFQTATSLNLEQPLGARTKPHLRVIVFFRPPAKLSSSKNRSQAVFPPTCCNQLTMTTEERKQMNSLCIQIQEEKDHRRFAALLQELAVLIRQKEARFPEHDGPVAWHRGGRPWKTLSGSVQKIVKNAYGNHAEKVQIGIDEAEHLFQEVRIENTFTDSDGQPVALKQGAHVDLTFEADEKDTVKKIADGRA